MPASYRFEGRLLRVTFWDDTPREETLETMDRMFADDSYPDNARFLLDLTSSTSLEKRSSDDIRALVEYVSQFKERYGSQMAVVVERPVQYGLVRMAGAFGETTGIQMRVFQSIEEALDWLGLVQA